MRIERDIVYDELNRKKCDIYFNQDGIQKPVVVLCHGGAWLLSSKKEMSEIAEFLTRSGYVCVAIEYTLSNFDSDLFQKIIISELLVFLILMIVVSSVPFKIGLLFAAFFLSVYAIIKMIIASIADEKTHPVHVKDVAMSIKFVHHQIHKYNGDGKNIFLLGHSAGAHLVSLVTTNPRFLTNLNVPMNIIKGVISISGPYSYFRLQESSVKHFTNRSVFGVQTDLNPKELFEVNQKSSVIEKDKWAKIIDAWPVFHEYAMSEKTPPFLLLTAGIDWSLLYHARDFADTLKLNNAHVQIVHFDSTNHFSIRTKWESKNKEIGNVVKSFISTIAQHCNR